MSMSIVLRPTLPSSSSSFVPVYHTFPLHRRNSADRNQWLLSHRTKGRAHTIMPNNVYSPKKESAKEVIMVDPLEAKRLAAKEMELIRAKQRSQRWREIEAVNGAWALIGLIAGLLIEGQTGKSILDQLSGYLKAITDLAPW